MSTQSGRMPQGACCNLWRGDSSRRPVRVRSCEMVRLRGILTTVPAIERRSEPESVGRVRTDGSSWTALLQAQRNLSIVAGIGGVGSPDAQCRRHLQIIVQSVVAIPRQAEGEICVPGKGAQLIPWSSLRSTTVHFGSLAPGRLAGAGRASRGRSQPRARLPGTAARSTCHRVRLRDPIDQSIRRGPSSRRRGRSASGRPPRSHQTRPDCESRVRSATCGSD